MTWLESPRRRRFQGVAVRESMGQSRAPRCVRRQEGGDEHYVYTQAAGESHAVKDNRANYVMRLYIASKAESSFAQPAATR